MADRWIILRTSAARTLKLAASLNAAGLEAWTPVGQVRRRKKGLRERVAAPIVPTFVFAPASHVAELLAASSAPVSPHPGFALFRHRDRFPLISDTSLNPLRQEERRHALAQRRSEQRTVATGTAVRPTEGPWAGMTGVVESAKGQKAVVNFGGRFTVEIATYLLPEDVLGEPPKPAPVGIAA